MPFMSRPSSPSPVSDPRVAGLIAAGICIASLATVSGHVVRGIAHPTLATAFVSSPSAALDAPIPIMWGTHDTGLRVACFYAANTSPARSDAPDWPRVTGIGFELPGARSGFSLLEPLDGNWKLVEGVTAAISGSSVVVDFAILAGLSPAESSREVPNHALGIAPGQPARRASGTRFCVSGPFPDGLNIEQVINGVLVRFHRVGHGPSVDVGVWDNALRTIPLYPD